jgi:hypothetical protein
MSQRPSAAERLDRAIDGLLDAPPSTAAVAAAASAGVVRPLVMLAQDLRAALPPIPAAPRFEAGLGTRLATLSAGASDPLGWALRHPGRLIVTGAVTSALGVGVTAYAVWRGSRRASAVHRSVRR